MGKRANDIMNMMNLQKAKNADYPDFTPAVKLELAKAQKMCAESAATMAANIDGADEEALTNMCVRNVAMVTPILNQSYFVRKEICQWDCPL